MKTKLKPVPWPELSTDRGAFTFTDLQLATEAKRAVKDYAGARLLDWRIILDKYGDCTLQVRYILADGIARYHNIAL